MSNHEDQGQMPRQWLPSIQEIFKETSLPIPPGPSYAMPSRTRHAAPPALPAVYEIDHPNERAPSNEQGLSSKIPTVERSLGVIFPINELQHPAVIRPENPSFPPNGCSLNGRCRFSKHPELSIPQPGSLSCDSMDLAQPSFAEPPNMFHEIPIRKIPIRYRVNQSSCVSRKNEHQAPLILVCLLRWKGTITLVGPSNSQQVSLQNWLIAQAYRC